MNIAMMVTGPFRTNCYIVSDESSATVIDPGLGAAAPLAEFLDDNGLSLEQVVLTHGHIDHTRDAAELANGFGVDVRIHPSDEFMLRDGAGVSAQAQQLFDAASMPRPNSLRHINDGDTVTICGEEFTILHAPGHSPGSVLLIGEKVCFCGDVVFQGSIGRTDLPDSSPQDMTTSLKRIADTLPASMHLLPGHGPETTMARELKTNPFLA